MLVCFSKYAKIDVDNNNNHTNSLLKDKSMNAHANCILKNVIALHAHHVHVP